ncbi:MAG: MoxR family ATPase [Chloroflexi bacterium]|jgi:MoxR-like ATPase|nr:MoxR family ATPase [Chloroflexota bacterium]MBT4342342.1 MoxR family ATPase [Chloroflexota bacterium]MBT7003721.1 MoxR family ATPase [Chloroflexota bacterium]MBT7079678.1 MoxR family ATPase [Chloroflexota bacterium]MBT7833386.1 MoxR family ATPase [Chloroflexota bacterium]
MSLTLIADSKTLVDTLIENVSNVIVGKSETVELVLVALLSNGHVLIEDVPGVGKTMLVRSIATSTGCDYRRMQFTPDLLPSDVTGASIFNQRTGEFNFRPGPIMAQIVLADEINRATPKTQSALLEAMGEQQVTVEGVTRQLPNPFMVLATQNPIEYEGTFPLPEAQLDRFFMRISLGYPDTDQEVAIMDRREHGDPIDSLKPVCTPGDITNLQRQTDEVFIDALVKQYIVELSNATRLHPEAALGVSPRASINLMKGGKAYAMLHERDYVVPDDIKAIAVPTLAHRVLLTPSARMRGVTQETVIKDVLNQVSVPGASVRKT